MCSVTRFDDVHNSQVDYSVTEVTLLTKAGQRKALRDSNMFTVTTAHDYLPGEHSTH